MLHDGPFQIRDLLYKQQQSHIKLIPSFLHSSKSLMLSLQIEKNVLKLMDLSCCFTGKLGKDKNLTLTKQDGNNRVEVAHLLNDDLLIIAY